MQTHSYWETIGRSRLSRRRVFGALGGASAAAALLAACGDGPADSGDANAKASGLVVKPADTTRQALRGGVMKDRISGDPGSLDPLVTSTPWNAVGNHVYSSLIQNKPGHLGPSENNLAPDLAQSWEWSPDGLSIALKLRPGVRWHDKAPVNARAFDVDDVLYSWDRFVAKSGTRASVANVVDSRAPVMSVTAPDAGTIVIKLKEPLVFALGLLASASSGGFSIVPKETDTSFDIRQGMIGTGPWSLSRYEPSVGFNLTRSPVYYDQGVAFLDEIDLPIVPEYAAALSQFKAGHIYTMGSWTQTPGVTQDDVLAVKREEPRISLYTGELRNAGSPAARIAFGWLPSGRSPFADERLRQAFSMSYDRDLFLDTFFNVTGFEAEGLSMETRWNSNLTATYSGWWLDPRGSQFGPNARYFEHDPTEVRRLLAAAGYAEGLNGLSSCYILTSEMGNVQKQAEVLDGMLRTAGIQSTPRSINYMSEYIPMYRDGNGQFEGYAYKSTAGGAGTSDPVGALSNEYWSKGGPTFHGFSASGTNDRSGDPQIDAIIEKARVEVDTEKRRALVFDAQRYLAKTMYAVPLPGYATGFTMAWPAVGNFRVYQGARPNHYLWLDSTKEPFARSGGKGNTSGS